MNRLVFLLVLSLFFSFGKSVLAEEGHLHGEATTKDPATALVTYVCPMHSEVRQTKPGECPICGMKLVSEEELHAHDKETQGQHNQGEHEGDHHRHSH